MNGWAMRDFFRIVEGRDGLVNVYLTPGEAAPLYNNLTGRTDYGIRILAVIGIDPEDPQWGGDLAEHVRKHYAAWLESAEMIEI